MSGVLLHSSSDGSISWKAHAEAVGWTRIQLEGKRTAQCPAQGSYWKSDLQAMAKLKQDLKKVHAEHRKMVQRLRACKPPPSSLGAHLLALKDPATGQALTDGQLEAELVTFFFAGVFCL